MTQPLALSTQIPLAIPATQPQRFVVIGLGGIGTPVAEHLSRYLMATDPAKPLLLVDGDSYEEGNRARMRFESYDNKAVSKSQELTYQTRGELRIIPIPAYASEDNIGAIIQESDCILLCVDNHATRKLVSDHCLTLRTVALFSGGNDGVDDTHTGTFGNVQAMIRQDGHNLTNALTTYHPEIAQPADRHPEKPGCDDLQPTLPQLLFTNLAVASAMLSTLYPGLQTRLSYEELYLDILTGRSVPLIRQVTKQSPAAARI
jgi:hypothetical protein